MGVAYTTYAGFSNATITVTTSAELNAAVAQLAGGSGGTIQVDPSGGPYDLSVSGVGSASAPVLIEPLGGGTPQFTSMSLDHTSYVTVTGMALDSSGLSGRGIYESDLNISNADHVEIVGNSFTGNAQGFLTETGGGVRGVNGMRLDDSTNVTVADNLFTNYYNAVVVNDTVNLQFQGNDVTQFQGDGFHAGGLVDSSISDNYIHDILGSTNAVAHSDFIQIFVNTSMHYMTTNLDISGNLIDAGTGPGGQGIHISNSLFGSGSVNDGYMQDIDIYDNVIHVSNVRGIGVNNVKGLDVYNNTVLWNEDSYQIKYVGATPVSYEPHIQIASPGANVSGNIASKIVLNGAEYQAGGYTLDYSHAGAANYVDNHITDIDGSSNGGVPDLSVLKSSALYGVYGAPMSSDGTTVSGYTGSTSGGSTSGGSTSGGGTVPVVTDPTVVYGDTDTSSGGDTGGDTSGSSGGASTDGSGSDTGSTGGDTTAGDTSGDTSDGTVSEPVVEDATVGEGGDTAGSTGGDTGSGTGGDTAGSGGDTSGSDGTVVDTGSTDTSSSTDTTDTTSSESEADSAKGNGKGNNGDAPGQAKKVYKATTADDGGNILTQILDAILGVFGGGSGSDSTDSSTHTAETSTDTSHETTDSVTLESVVPVTEWLDESDTAQDDEEEDPVLHLAA